MALPRLALALLLGTVISTPFVLRIFASEINNQISVIKENNEAVFLSSQQDSAVGARVTKWQNTVNNLQQVIDSDGAQPINPANDPEIQGLTTELNNERTVATTDYKAWQCQLYGGCGAPKGSGPLAAASEQQYDQDEAQIASLTSQINARKQQLQASSASSQQSRLQQAQGALPNAKAQLAAAQGEQDSLLNNFESTNSATNGLLIRLEALDQLSAKGGSLSAARWLLFLLFLVIELLPVSVKLMQQPGLYEQILEEKDRYQLREAKWQLRSGAWLGPEPDPAAGKGVGPPPRDGGGFLPRGPMRYMSTAELKKLFDRTQTTVMPAPAPAREQAPDRGDPWRGPTADVPGTAGPSRLDEQLTRLDDGRRPGPTGSSATSTHRAVVTAANRTGAPASSASTVTTTCDRAARPAGAVPADPQARQRRDGPGLVGRGHAAQAPGRAQAADQVRRRGRRSRQAAPARAPGGPGARQDPAPGDRAHL
jgi:hypothetical protein